MANSVKQLKTTPHTPLFMFNTILPKISNIALSRQTNMTIGQWVQKPMTRVENLGVYGIIAKELFGINSPKIIEVRNVDELKDSATNELSNTIGYFGLGAITNTVYNWAFKGVKQATTFQREAKIMGKSWAMCLTLGSFIWSVPFIRNYITAGNTGTTKFTRLIGESSLLSKQTPAEFKREKKRFLNTALAVFGSGLALSAAVLIGARRAIRKGRFNAPDLIKKMAEKFKFGEGNFKHMNNYHAAWFWGLPCYLGLIHASREKHEKIEQGIKALSFFAMFFAVPEGIKRIFLRNKFYPQKMLNHFKETPKHLLDATNPVAKELQVSFSKAGIKDLLSRPEFSHLADKKSKLLTNWGMQQFSAYLGSTIALFISNYAANAISINLTSKRVNQHERDWANKRFKTMDAHTVWKSPQHHSLYDFLATKTPSQKAPSYKAPS